MSLSRRSFVKNTGIGAAGLYLGSLVSNRTRESIAFARETGLPLDQVINLANNENPLGAGDTVMAAVRSALGPDAVPAGRYPFASEGPLQEAIAAKFKVKPENVLIGAGSTQILVDATHRYASKEKALVGSLPTYEECFGYAAQVGYKTKAVPLMEDYTVDLDQTMHACKNGGMLFYCNPNNPVASLVKPSDSKQFLPKVLEHSPDLRVLVDEAYIDYVTTPGHETMIPLAVQEPRMIVARTFSKAYGMAGLRIGYAIAHPDTIKELQEFHLGNSISALSYAAALAAVERDMKDPDYVPNERKRNLAARDYIQKFFHDRGHKTTDSQCNFIFADTKMPVEDFQAACRKEGVRVGRPFPPLWTMCRISIGTMDEMQKATQAFAKILDGAKSMAA